MDALNGTSTLGAAAASQPRVKSGDEANNMDFLQFLVMQLKNQSPLNPADSQSMMQQMAMMQMVSETRMMRTELKEWAQAQSLSGASALVGRNVSVMDGGAELYQGKVQSVSFREGHVTVKMGGVDFPLKQVVDVH